MRGLASAEAQKGCGNPMGFSGNLSVRCGDRGGHLCQECEDKDRSTAPRYARAYVRIRNSMVSDLTDRQLDTILDSIRDAIENIAAGELYSAADGNKLIADFTRLVVVVRRERRIEEAAIREHHREGIDVDRSPHQPRCVCGKDVDQCDTLVAIESK
jgi:hypothetical protein